MVTEKPTQDSLPFEQQQLLFRSSENGKFMRVMNTPSTIDYLHIFFDKKQFLLTFHTHDDNQSPILFTIQKLPSGHFRIVDCRNSQEITIEHHEYISGEKYQFELPDGTKYAWKPLTMNWKLISYPKKERVAFLKFESATMHGKSVGNAMTFSPSKEHDPWYHFSWLSGFALNWESLYEYRPNIYDLTPAL
jgi:hypothetical protein